MQENVKWTNGKGLGITIFNDVNLISRFVNNFKNEKEKNLVTKNFLFQNNVCIYLRNNLCLSGISFCIFCTSRVIRSASSTFVAFL